MCLDLEESYQEKLRKILNEIDDNIIKVKENKAFFLYMIIKPKIKKNYVHTKTN